MRPGPCYIKPRVKRQNKSSTGLNVRRRLIRVTLLSCCCCCFLFLYFFQEPVDNSVFYTLMGILSCYNIRYYFIYLFIMQNGFPRYLYLAGPYRDGHHVLLEKFSKFF